MPNPVEIETIYNKIRDAKALTDEELQHLSLQLGLENPQLEPALLAKLSDDILKLIVAGQRSLSARAFRRHGSTLAREGIYIALVAFLASSAIALLALVTTQPGTILNILQPDGYCAVLSLWVNHLAPILLGGVGAYYAAAKYVHWRQERDTVFKLIEELNSRDFEETRHSIIKLAQNATSSTDIDDLKTWFPDLSLQHAPPNRKKAFREQTALHRMAYFTYRIFLYHHHSMIDLSVTRHMFHDFFSNYNVLLLELCEALKNKRRRQGLPEGSAACIPERRRREIARLSKELDEGKNSEQKILNNRTPDACTPDETARLASLRKQRSKLTKRLDKASKQEHCNEKLLYDERWDMLADGIQGFLRLIGLADQLPFDHRFVFFPTVQENFDNLHKPL